jgi:hypothetical protein
MYTDSAIITIHPSVYHKLVPRNNPPTRLPVVILRRFIDAIAAFPHSLSTSLISVDIVCVCFFELAASPFPSPLPRSVFVAALASRAIVAGIKNVPSMLTTNIGNSAPSASVTSSCASPNPCSAFASRRTASVVRHHRAFVEIFDLHLSTPVASSARGRVARARLGSIARASHHDSCVSPRAPVVAAR